MLFGLTRQCSNPILLRHSMHLYFLVHYLLHYCITACKGIVFLTIVVPAHESVDVLGLIGVRKQTCSMLTKH